MIMIVLPGASDMNNFVIIKSAALCFAFFLVIPKHTQIYMSNVYIYISYNYIYIYIYIYIYKYIYRVKKYAL